MKIYKNYLYFRYRYGFFTMKNNWTYWDNKKKVFIHNVLKYLCTHYFSTVLHLCWLNQKYVSIFYFLFFKKKPTIFGVTYKKKSQILLCRFVFIVISIMFTKHWKSLKFLYITLKVLITFLSFVFIVISITFTNLWT